jgi:acetyltransferase-like isoleucine patch superfamily enzyme
MKIIEFFYKLANKEAPYYAKYNLFTIIWKPIRKFINVVIIPNIPFNSLRIFLYRLIGFKIGKNVFIGMKCYLDDLEPKMQIIKDNAVISYGCYFACHGKNQSHTTIIIEEGAYLGMKTSVISGKKGITIGKKAIIGACSFVNKDIPEEKIFAGVPANELKKIK